MKANRENRTSKSHLVAVGMVFTRNIVNLGTFNALPGELTITFPDIGGSFIDPFPILRFTVVNPSESGTFDFETEEVSGVATVKYLYNNGVMRKQEITDIITSSPILVMQDVFSPIAYIYPDDTTLEEIDEFQQSKSRKQEILIPSDYALPVIQTPLGEIPDFTPDWRGVRRYGVKGNWHYFSDSIICDTVSIFVRRRIKSGLMIEAINFL